VSCRDDVLLYDGSRNPRDKAPEMTGTVDLAEIDQQISEVRANLRDIVEQASARSGAQDENQSEALIEQQEDRLKRLMEQREALDLLSKSANPSK
jgi:hypothetical protein